MAAPLPSPPPPLPSSLFSSSFPSLPSPPHHTASPYANPNPSRHHRIHHLSPLRLHSPRLPSPSSLHAMQLVSLPSASPPLRPLPSPLHPLLSTSFSASLSSIPPAIFTAKSILSFSSNNPNRKNAATNCIEFLTLSLYRLTIASKLMSISSPPFPSVGILYSAALLYQYECCSAYKYVNDSSTVSDAMAFLANNLTALTSNTVSMLAALQRYGDDMSLWGPPQRERWVLA